VNPVGVPLAQNCLLGEPRILGVAFDRLDDPFGVVSQAERRIAEAASDLKNSLRGDCHRERGKERAAGRGVHAAARSVEFAMVMGRKADVLEWVPLALGGLDPLGDTLR
jgi:hypothetical protein